MAREAESVGHIWVAFRIAERDQRPCRLCAAYWHRLGTGKQWEVRAEDSAARRLRHFLRPLRLQPGRGSQSAERSDPAKRRGHGTAILLRERKRNSQLQPACCVRV